MNKLFVLLALLMGVFMIATSSVGALSSSSTGSARLHPIDGSGIHARISFIDTGNDDSGVIVSGTATGLDPEKFYLSAISDNGSVPGGPQACQPTVDKFDEEQMFIGRWQVNADGTGTLFTVMREGGYVPLSEFDTVSIRELTIPGRPDLAPVVACGQINKHK